MPDNPDTVARGVDDLPPEVIRELRAWSEPNFICVCCQKEIDCRWNRRDSGRQIPPICCVCERVSGYDWTGRARYRSKPTGGSFMDRRNAVRILALAEELAQAATRKNWSEANAA